MQRRKLRWSGGDLATVSNGDSGPAIFFLHGNSSCHQIFSNQIVALPTRGLKILAADLPGHGGSENAHDPKETYCFPGYAKAMQFVLDEYAIDQAHLVGWSLGGHVALELMGQDSRVVSAMIFGTPPIKPGPGVIETAFKPSKVMSLAGKEHFTDSDAQLYGSQMLGADSLLTPELLAAVRRTDGRARKHMVESGLGGVGLDQRRLVETDDRPFAVLHGRADPFLSLSYLESISYRAIWRQKIQIFDTAGHAPHWQKPSEFNALLLDWLDHVV